MSYLDSGFNKFLYKSTLPPAPVEVSEASSSQMIPLLTGTSIAGGITESQNGKIRIDWDLGQILIGNGAHWLVLLGDDGL